MTASRANIEAIFHAARDIPEPDSRREYVREACFGNETLIAHVEALLAAADTPDSLLDRPPVGEALGDGTRTGPLAADADGGLDFLEPSDKPGSLGRLGHYEVQDVVGRGGMGVVLKAFDESLHRVVAIKVMAAQLATSATARRRFVREARAAAAVTHDHVITIHAVEESGALPHIVMQYVAGASLQDRLDRTGPLQLHEALRIGMQTASGLAAAHAQGLVHRDVKPANILLENGVERVRLTDFGLARAADDASLTQSGTVAGTPAFMSPEQAEGKPIDHRSDLFSLGSVLYAMCTGRPPFRAGTGMGVLRRVCEDAPTPIRETNPAVPDWLAAVVEKLHAKDPAGRFQSAAEVAEVLGRHLAHVQHPPVILLPAPAEPACGPPVAVRPGGRKRWTVAAAVLVAALAVLGTTEATGVTNFRATVIRIFAPEGTLVVETGDPDVKVTIEGDGELVISGAGPQEVRLKAGSYRVRAARDGKPVKLDRDLVSISRGDREIVRVRLEDEHPAAVAPQVRAGMFALLGGRSVAERKFDTLAEAVQGASDGDTIEVRGNGPFDSGPVTITDKRALTIRAGNGSRPVLRLKPGTAERPRHLVSTDGPLVLEGLEVQSERSSTTTGADGYVAVAAHGGLLHVANCRFITPNRHALYVTDSRLAVVKNCEFLGGRLWSEALVGPHAPGGAWELANCVLVGSAGICCGARSPDVRDATVRIRRCSAVNCQLVIVSFHTTPKNPETGKSAKLVRFEVSGTLMDAGVLFSTYRLPTFLDGGNPLHAARAEEVIRRLVDWRGTDNVHHQLRKAAPDPADAMIWWGSSTGGELLSDINDLAAWRKFWDSPETGSIQGQIRYAGGDLVGRLADGPAKITPEDFRLRPDSAGYRAGKDGKDLGADVDLVGPGPAYERWKKTPDHQQWRKETGQSK